VLAWRVAHRDVEPHDVAAKLRGMLGLDPDRPAPGEHAATFDRPLPPLLSKLAAGGWIAWCLAGLPVFSGGLPSLTTARKVAVRTVVVWALLSVRGNLSAAERLTGSSRKVLRDIMKRESLHPWHETLRRVSMRAPKHGGRPRIGERE
jgi:hypothetical protein